MRLWHKDLISVLPKNQLCGQWRECCLIAKAISENGTPNHLLVNKIDDYSIFHFLTYCDIVIDEMRKRNFKVSTTKIEEIKHLFFIPAFEKIEKQNLFYDWHNDRYLRQCLYNLQEKYDCGGISETEWQPIAEMFKQLSNIT